MSEPSNTTRLFHGTTASRAAKIRQEGFKALTMTSEVSRTATSYGVDPEILQQYMADQYRFATHDNRKSAVYLARESSKAGSWAQRAPEVVWESLVHIYRLRHPELGDDWNQDDALHWWVLRERLNDPPVVITVDVPNEQLETSPHDEVKVSCPLSAATVIQVKEVPWRIDGSLMRYIAGFSSSQLSEFSERVAADMYGPKTEDPNWGPPWWQWRHIRPTLSEQRLEELWRAE